MDKILSKDTIKNVFSALGAKTSDSNYGVALLDKTSGEPKGFMGMSDLASVLGGAASTSTSNLNNIGIGQTGMWNPSTTNTPYDNSEEKVSSYGVCVCFGFSDNKMQFSVRTGGPYSKDLHYRYQDSGTWGAWKKISVS